MGSVNFSIHLRDLATQIVRKRKTKIQKDSEKKVSEQTIDLSGYHPESEPGKNDDEGEWESSE